MAGYSAGAVFVQVVPSFKDFQSNAGVEMRKQGGTLGKEFGNGFQEATKPGLDKVELKLDELSKKGNVDVKVDTKKATEDLDKLKAKIDEMGNAKTDVTTSGVPAAMASLERVEALLKKIDGQNAKAHVTVDDKGSVSKLGKQYEALTKDVASTVKEVDLASDHISNMTKKVGKINTAGLKAVERDAGLAEHAVSKLENTTRQAGVTARESTQAFRGYSTMMAGIVSLGPAILPVMGGIVGAAAALGPAAIAAGAGLGTVIIGLSGIKTGLTAFNAMNTAIDTFGKDSSQAGRAILVWQHNMRQLGAEGTTLVKTLSRAQDTVTEMAKQGRKAFWPGLAASIDLMNNHYGPQLQAFVKKTSKLTGDLTLQMTKAFTNPAADTFFGNFRKETPFFLKNFTAMTINFVEGIGKMLVALTPLSEWFIHGLTDMSKSFDDWAGGLSKNEKFQEFVEYAKRNIPLLGQILKDLGGAFFNVAFALEPWGHTVLVTLDNFLKWLKDTNPKTIRAIGVAILAMVGGFQALTGIVSGYGVLKDMFALIKSFRSPLISIAGLVAALGTAFVIAGFNDPDVKKSLDELIGKLKNGLTNALGDVTRAFNKIWDSKMKKTFKDLIDTITKDVLPAVGKLAKALLGISDAPTAPSKTFTPGGGKFPGLMKPSTGGSGVRVGESDTTDLEATFLAVNDALRIMIGLLKVASGLTAGLGSGIKGFRDATGGASAGITGDKQGAKDAIARGNGDTDRGLVGDIVFAALGGIGSGGKFKNSQTGTDETATKILGDTLKEDIAGIGGVISGAWNSVIGSIFGTTDGGKIDQWWENNVSEPTRNFLTKTLPGLVSDGWSHVWDFLSADTVGDFSDSVDTWMSDNVWGPIGGFFTNTVGPGISSAWTSVWSWLTSYSISDSVDTWMGNNVWGPIGNFFDQTVWPGIQGFWSGIWNWVTLKFEAASAIVRWIGANVWSPIRDWWEKTFLPGVQSKWRSVWNWLTSTSINDSIDNWANKNIWNPIANFWNKKFVPGWKGFWNGAVSTIKDIFGKVPDTITGILRGVGNIINTWVITPFNNLAKTLKLSIKIPLISTGGDPKKVNPQTGFGHTTKAATGGIMPGYTPGRDVHQFYSPTGGRLELSGGEPILRPEAGRVLGKDWVDSINMAARTRGTSGVRKFLDGSQAYSKGGLIDFGHWLQAHGARVSENPAFGGVSPVHVPGSLHYTGNAIDVNTRAGTSLAEQKELAAFVPEARKRGFRVIFMSAGHYNHAHFDTSTGPEGSLLGNLKKLGVNLVGGALSGIVDLAAKLTNPIAKEVTKLTSQGPIQSMIGGMLSSLGKSAVKFLDPFNIFSGDEGADSGETPAGSGVQRWADDVKLALKANGLPTSAAYVNAWLKQIQTESGGNEKAVQGDIGDINNRTGDLAKGLVQTISATFNSNKFAGHGDIFNGYDNLLAAIHYAKDKYGKSMLDVIGHGHGYKDGGLLDLGSLGGLKLSPESQPQGGMVTPSLNDAGSSIPANLATVVMNRTRRPETLLPFDPKDLKNSLEGNGGGAGQTVNFYGVDMDQSTKIKDDLNWEWRKANAGGRYR
jgi:hypothetical protein